MAPQPTPTLGALDLRGDGRPTVILRHDLPNGSHHFDWMIASDVHGAHTLATFRLSENLLNAQPGDVMECQRLPDHRREYLQYEGPVSGGRGTVHRIGTGRIITADRLSSEESGEWRVAVDWTNRQGTRIGVQNLSLRPGLADAWIIKNLAWKEDAHRPARTSYEIMTGT